MTSDDRALQGRADADKPSTVQVVQRAAIGFVALVAGLCLLGGIGSLLLFDGAVGDAEADFVSWIANERISVLDSVATTASTLSDTWTVIGVLIGAVSMLWMSGHGRYGATILLAVALELATFLVVGAIIGRTRPDVDALNSVPSTPSFPSGHAAAAFVLYGSLVLVARILAAHKVPRWFWVVPIAIGLLVAFARVYEGVHHPIDVVAGLLLGVGALAAASIATGIVEPRSNAT